MGDRINDLRALKDACDVGTWKILEPFPIDKIDFSPFPGMMSFGDIVFHLALAERVVMKHIAHGLGIELDYKDVGHGEDLNSLLQELKKTWMITSQIMNQMEDADLDKEILFEERNIKSTITSLLGAMIEHSVHQRGEVVVYYRALGLTPPQRWGD